MRSLSLQILVAMVLGLLVGTVGGHSVASLGVLGSLLIQMIKTIATPLLFLSIVNSVVRYDIEWKSGFRMVLIAGFNATIALAIGLALSNLFHPGDLLKLPDMQGVAADSIFHAEKIDFWKTLESYVPKSFLEPFSANILVTIVVMALMIGLGVRQVHRQSQFAEGVRAFENLVEVLLETTTVILSWIVKLVPLAVFGVVAKTIGQYGWAPFYGLGFYLVIGISGLLLQIGVTYQIWIRYICGMSLRRFWSVATEPVVYAAGANSSLATLPLTLKALDELKVSRKSSTLGACVGTNLNNDGILLYEAMAALMVAQAVGMDLSLSQQMMVVGASCVASLGIAGVPDAGIVSLSLVLVTVGLPLEILPLLLSVDWIIARMRSVTNVVSDMVVSMALERWEKGAPLT